MSNFSGIPEMSKIILTIVMIIVAGKIITVLTIFTRTFWRI